MTRALDRRGWLKGVFASAAGLALSACDKITEAKPVTEFLINAQGLNRRVHRLIGGNALAREFSLADISPDFRANGNTRPDGTDYAAHVTANFADWRLKVDGLVERPLALSMAEVRNVVARTQITRHDCVEGWSSIGQWKGAKLSAILEMAGLKPEAKFIVFHCADSWDAEAPDGDYYYESVDLVDAYHPQTILAYEMNGAPLPIAHGAPLRLRAERHLGYKQAKYVMRLEAVASFDHIGKGKGGFWEDRGYEWYAGI